MKGAESQRDRDTERHRTEIDRWREAGGERDRWSQRRGGILEILISLESWGEACLFGPGCSESELVCLYCCFILISSVVYLNKPVS